MFGKPVKFIDGLSESAWKSLVVKSLRIGWVTGLEEAAKRLPPSTLNALLLCGIFEDIFPAESELADVLAEVRGLDFAALCARQTHHARGYTAHFCDMETVAVEAAEHERGRLWAEAKARDMWLPNRALNCFFTWLVIKPKDAGVRREVDRAPWTGMPTVMLDGHTYEGKVRKTLGTLLSGHYHNHRALAERLSADGGFWKWQSIRAEVHGGGTVECLRHAKQNTLF